MENRNLSFNLGFVNRFSLLHFFTIEPFSELAFFLPKRAATDCQCCGGGGRNPNMNQERYHHHQNREKMSLEVSKFFGTKKIFEFLGQRRIFFLMGYNCIQVHYKSKTI